jgi:hypothetical protein
MRASLKRSAQGQWLSTLLPARIATFSTALTFAQLSNHILIRESAPPDKPLTLFASDARAYLLKIPQGMLDMAE